MKNQNSVRIGQIGCGYWGTNIARNVINNRKAELAAVCDIDTAALERMDNKYPGVAQYLSFSEMFEKEIIDAVIVVSPTDLHYQHVLAALEAGKHVFVEKPMASSVNQAAEIVKMAERSKQVLMVGHTFMYNNIVKEVKKWIDSGELGEIYYAYSQRLNLGRFRQDCDVLWTLAPHDISIINYWFDSSPSQVNARGITCIGKECRTAQVCFGLLEYPDGKKTHLQMSWLDPQKKRKIVVVGSKKMLVYDDMNNDRHIQIYDKRVELEYSKPTEGFADFTARIRAGDVVIPNILLIEPLAVEIDHFIDCIITGAKPVTDGRHGLNTIAVLESMTDSINQGGRTVPVKYYDLMED